MSFTILKPIVTILYFAVILFFTFFAAFTVYILLKYGRSLMVAFLTSSVFLVIFVTIIFTSYSSLSNLSF
jgi:hypothetical protein